MTDATTTTDPSPSPEGEPDARRGALRGLSTLPELRAALEGEQAALRDAEKVLEVARATYESATRLAAYSDEALAAAQRHHEPALVEAERAAARAASDAQDTVRAILAQLPADRMAIDPATETVAASRAVILGQVIQTASLPQLRDDLRAALQAGDQATCYVMANFLPARLAAAPPPNEPNRPEIGAARAEIAALLGRVRADLRDTSADPVRKLAAEVRDKAATARRPARVRQQQAALDADIASGRKIPWPVDPHLRAP